MRLQLAAFAAALLTNSPALQAAEPAPGPELGRAATEVTLQVEIEAHISEVWTAFSTIGNIYLSSPTVSASHLSSDITSGIGATRHMEMSIKEGATLDERVIEWTQGSYMALEVYKIVGVTGVQTMGGTFGS